jgi:hypothetical protein
MGGGLSCPKKFTISIKFIKKRCIEKQAGKISPFLMWKNATFSLTSGLYSIFNDSLGI